MVATEYRKTYRIYEISADGLLKVPMRSEGYGYYAKEDHAYDTEQDAVDRVIEKELDDCIVVATVSRHWVEDPS